MRIGVSSYSFSKFMDQSGADYLKICDLAKEMGFDGIEFIDLSLDRQKAENLNTLARTIRTHCDRLELPIIAYTVHADFLKGGHDEVERLKSQIDIASLLGAPVMRHDACWGAPKGMGWREVVKRIEEPVRQTSMIAKSKGIKTCTENHGYLLQDSERVETLIQSVAYENYGWLVDMGNFLCADELAIHALPIAAPYCFHAHAKDFLYKPAWEQKPSEDWFPTRNGSHLRGTVVGHGVVPIPFCVKTLQESGYQGWLSYEFEGMEENLSALRAGRLFN